MTFHTYFQYVYLLIVLLYMVPAIDLQAQGYQRQADTHTLVIVDKGNGLPIEGAYIFIENQSFVSSSNGTITFPWKPSINDSIFIQGMGYIPQHLSLTEAFKKDNIYTVQLLPDIKALEEVIVLGKRSTISSNMVSNKLSSAAINNALGTSLSSLLEQVSGVSSISTGTTVAKPVIQGMYGNRILLINNGTRQTGQQWGIDHAPEVDMNSSTSIQIIKGSDAVRYGSDALGGVIVMEQDTLPFQKKTLQGKISILYGSNGRRYVLTGRLEGAFPFLCNLAWRIQGSYLNSGDRSTAKYLLNNTGTREHHISASLGYDHKDLRIEGFYSRFYNQSGVMLSAQMGSEDLLTERIRLGRPIHTDPFTRHIIYPYQKITHQTAIGKARFRMKHAGDLYWQSSWQKDDRQENRIRRIDSNVPAVSLHLSSFQHLLRWKWSYNSWQTEAGGQLIFIDNHNQEGTGIVPIIPNYTETQWGIYTIAKYSHSKGGIEAGIRFDGQETRASGYDWTGSLYGGKRIFEHISYNVGSHYQPSRHWKFTTHLGVAWRAPHVYELYSNGNELGSGMFVKGDSTMRSERSYKWISSISFQNHLFSIRVDGYLQWINSYIYDEPQKKNITVISGTYPVFQYKQTPAFFRGMDLDLHFMPTSSWDYHLTTSLIQANEQTLGNYLPYIPSFRLNHALVWKHETQKHLGIRLSIRHRFVAKQNRFNPDTDLIPYTPAAYHLFGFDSSLEYPVKHGHTLQFMISADNILNKAYKEYTNRSRYYAHDIGRDIRFGINWIF